MVITDCVSIVNKSLSNKITYLVTYLPQFKAQLLFSWSHFLLGVVMSSFISFKMYGLQNSEKFPKFHLTVHQIPSYQTGIVSFIFWICLLHCHSYSKPVNHYPTLLEVLWQLWVPPSSVFKTMQWLPIPVLENHHLCITQASFLL